MNNWRSYFPLNMHSSKIFWIRRVANIIIIPFVLAISLKLALTDGYKLYFVSQGIFGLLMLFSLVSNVPPRKKVGNDDHHERYLSGKIAYYVMGGFSFFFAAHTIWEFLHSGIVWKDAVYIQIIIIVSYLIVLFVWKFPDTPYENSLEDFDHPGNRLKIGI